MGAIKFVLRLIGWLVTIILQVAGSFLIIFVFTVLFPGSDTISRLGWLALLFMLWFGYGVGINLIGQLALRFVWRDVRPLTNQRLLGTAIGGVIPLLILVVIGSRYPVGGEGTQFYEQITNNWQIVMAQAALYASIIGFYMPGLIVTRRQVPVPG